MEVNEFVSFLSKISDKQRQVLLLHLTRNQLQFVVEIVYNIAQGNIPVTNSEKTRLLRRKDDIRKVLTSELTRKQRTKRLLKISKLLPFVIDIYLNHESRNGFDS